MAAVEAAAVLVEVLTEAAPAAVPGEEGPTEDSMEDSMEGCPAAPIWAVAGITGPVAMAAGAWAVCSA